MCDANVFPPSCSLVLYGLTVNLVIFECSHVPKIVRKKCVIRCRVKTPRKPSTPFSTFFPPFFFLAQAGCAGLPQILSQRTLGALETAVVKLQRERERNYSLHFWQQKFFAYAYILGCPFFAVVNIISVRPRSGTAGSTPMGDAHPFSQPVGLPVCLTSCHSNTLSYPAPIRWNLIGEVRKAIFSATDRLGYELWRKYILKSIDLLLQVLSGGG